MTPEAKKKKKKAKMIDREIFQTPPDLAQPRRTMQAVHPSLLVLPPDGPFRLVWMLYPFHRICIIHKPKTQI